MTAKRNLDADLDFAAQLADAAWAAIRSHFRALTQVDGKANSSKPGFDPVTEADRASQPAILTLVPPHRPGVGGPGAQFPDTASASG